ncbi:hypothetical protein Cgig2_008614 [Carnegiea gigantea]|uniref:Uncharacterized protein n=1 Tax=Carnegiea gigantea TaxID=171969 RepID=A0A9Q1JXX3_9CARY|nr:hypothetical protein Cgig2_008614 [Carnegiea gigantea]
MPLISSQPEQGQPSTSPPRQVVNRALDSLPGDIVYPHLVRLFYANFETKMDGNGMYPVSLVKSMPIIINSSVLSTVFGLKFTNLAPPSLTCKMAKALCLTYYACPQKLATYKCQNRAPPYHVLFPEPRLPHYVFVCIFYLKDHSKEAYNEVALESIYHLMNGYSVDYASIIVNYMYQVANMSCPSSLPYGNLLTRIFTHFKVPFESEDCVTQTVPVLFANSLKSLYFYKAAIRGWKHASELTSTEATELHAPLSDQPTLHALRESLESLREDYVELRTQRDLMHTDMGLLGKKMDELIRMTSMVHHGARLIITFTSSNLDRATQVADRIIQSTSFGLHFT